MSVFVNVSGVGRIYRRGNVWYLDYWVDGVRIREKSGGSKDEALKELSTKVTDINRGNLGFLEKKKVVAFSDFAEESLKIKAGAAGRDGQAAPGNCRQGAAVLLVGAAPSCHGVPRASEEKGGKMKKRKKRNLTAKDGLWWVDYRLAIGREKDPKTGKMRIKYRRVRESFKDPDDAKLALAKVEEKRREERRAKKLGIVMPAADNVNLGFKEYAEAVANEPSDRRPSSQAGLRKCIKGILRSDLFVGKRMVDITPPMVEAYKHERRAHPTAANAELAVLKMIFKRAVNHGELTRNPAALVKFYKVDGRRLRILEDHEVKLLLNAADPAITPVLLTLLSTGMRPHEVFALHWQHEDWELDDDLGVSIVDLKRMEFFIPKSLTKNHRDRRVPMSPELVALYEDMGRKAKRPKVFKMNSIDRSFHAAVTAAKLKKVVLYTLKHTAASRMIKAGVDIVTVSEILGHSDIKQTMRYCHATPASKREAIEKVSKVYFAPAPTADAAPEKQPNQGGTRKSGQNVDRDGDFSPYGAGIGI